MAEEETRRPFSIRFSIEVTPEERARIRRLARQSEASEREAVLEAVARALERASPAEGNGGGPTPEREEQQPGLPEAQPGSLLEGIRDLIPTPDEPSGPPDLSTNPRYLEDLGRDEATS